MHRKLTEEQMIRESIELHMLNEEFEKAEVLAELVGDRRFVIRAKFEEMAQCAFIALESWHAALALWAEYVTLWRPPPRA